MKLLNLAVDYLWRSGKKRATRTAEFLAEVVKINEGQIIHDGLGPNDDVTALKNELISADISHIKRLAAPLSLISIRISNLSWKVKIFNCLN